MPPVPALSDDDWKDLSSDLLERIAVVAPEWTNFRESDPGVTIVEIFAFLAESLGGRRELSPPARMRLRDVIAQLEAVHRTACPDPEPLTRVRYFHGRMLTAADLEEEQAYHRGKQRRHNLLLHGTGIVNGLEVSVERGGHDGEPRVVVSPGLAIGPDGEELLVCEHTSAPLGSSDATAYVTLGLSDRLVAPMPVGDGEEASRVEEVVELDVLADVPPSRLALARLERARDRWRLDPAFRPRRPGR